MESRGEDVVMGYAMSCMHVEPCVFVTAATISYDLALCCVLAGYWDDTLMNSLLSQHTTYPGVLDS